MAERKAADLECLDLDGMACQGCGQTNALTSHHIKYRSDGGTDDQSNRITFCVTKWGVPSCHHREHHGCNDNGTRLSGRKWVRNRLRELKRERPDFRWDAALEELEVKTMSHTIESKYTPTSLAVALSHALEWGTELAERDEERWSAMDEDSLRRLGTFAKECKPTEEVKTMSKWYICKCGGGQEDADEQTICPDCHRIGCWIESEDQSE